MGADSLFRNSSHNLSIQPKGFSVESGKTIVYTLQQTIEHKCRLIAITAGRI